MKRFILPFIIALIVHVAVILGNIGFFKKEPIKDPEIKFMTMTLSHVEAPQPEKEPQKKNIKKKKKLRPKKTEKKIVQEKKLINEPKIMETKEEKETIEEKEEVEETKGVVAKIYKAFPLYKHNPPAHYPRSAKRRGWQGVVKIEFVVDIYGRVKSLRLVKTSGYSILDKSALKAVKSWRFSPGKQGDKPVETAVVLPVRFTLS